MIMRLPVCCCFQFFQITKSSGPSESFRGISSTEFGKRNACLLSPSCFIHSLPGRARLNRRQLLARFFFSSQVRSRLLFHGSPVISSHKTVGNTTRSRSRRFFEVVWSGPEARSKYLDILLDENVCDDEHCLIESGLHQRKKNGCDLMLSSIWNILSNGFPRKETGMM
jgi:hypothetical protein